MKIAIAFENGRLLFELLQSDSVSPGDSLELAPGVTVRLVDSFTQKGGLELGQLATFAIEKGESTPFDVVAAVVSGWICTKLRSKKARVTINRKQVDFDDRGNVRRVIEEELRSE